jgi:hypothetical protein
VAQADRVKFSFDVWASKKPTARTPSAWAGVVREFFFELGMLDDSFIELKTFKIPRSIF